MGPDDIMMRNGLTQRHRGTKNAERVFFLSAILSLEKMHHLVF